MKVDLTAMILDRAGQPIEVEGDTDGSVKPLSLRDMLLTAIDQQQAADAQASAKDKIGLFLLGMRVFTAAECEFTAEEIALLKARIAAGFTPHVVGRAWQLLDSASVPDVAA